MEGWIKLHRRFLEWEWFDDSDMVKLFMYLLLNANHKEGNWKGVNIKRGQLITGYNVLSNQLNMSIKVLRNRLQKLEKSGEIGRQTGNQFTVITICNYDTYNSDEDDKGRQMGKQRASKGQAKGKQRATNKNEENDKNEENNKEPVKNLFNIDEPKYSEKKQVEFSNSSVYKFDNFKLFFKEEIEVGVDVFHYYQALKSWADKTGKKRKSWIAEGRGFMLSDKTRNKLIIIKTEFDDEAAKKYLNL